MIVRRCKTLDEIVHAETAVAATTTTTTKNQIGQLTAVPGALDPFEGCLESIWLGVRRILSCEQLLIALREGLWKAGLDRGVLELRGQR